MGRICYTALAAIAVLITTTTCWGQFTEGQAVQVREGDLWSPAQIIKKEGRRYQIRYSDSNEQEWVAADRLRIGDESAAPATAATLPADAKLAPPAKAAQKPGWSVNDAVECKWGGTWFKARVLRAEGPWYLVHYSDDTKEWVEAWRIRRIGADYDIGHASPNRHDLKRVPDAAPKPAPKGVRGDSGIGKPGAQNTASEKNPDGAGAAGTAAEAPRLDLEDGGSTMTVQPDPAPALTFAISTRPVALRCVSSLPASDRGMLEIAGPFFAGTPAGIAVVGAKRAAGTQLIVERIDLKSGVSLGVAKFPVENSLIDVSPDGQSVLIGHIGIGARQSEGVLQVVRLDGKSPQVVASFKAFPDSFFKAATSACFISNDMVLARNHECVQAVWKLPEATMVYKMAHAGDTLAVLSPGKHQQAICANAHVHLIDPVTGKTLGRYNQRLNNPSFSPDGKWLTGSDGRGIILIDLTTATVSKPVPVPHPAFGVSATTIDASFALVEGSRDSYLLDLNKGVLLWQYRHSLRDDATPPTAAPPMVPFAGRMWTVCSAGSQVVLTSVLVPDSAAQQAAAAARAPPLKVAPGSPVSVVVKVDADAKTIDTITRGIQANLKEAGYNVVANAPLRLVASSTADQTAEVSFHDELRHDLGKRKLTSLKLHLALEQNSEVLWSAEGSYDPIGRDLYAEKPGETIDQVLARLKADAMKFYTQVTVPGSIQDDSSGKANMGVTDLAK